MSEIFVPTLFMVLFFAVCGVQIFLIRVTGTQREAREDLRILELADQDEQRELVERIGLQMAQILDSAQTERRFAQTERKAAQADRANRGTEAEERTVRQDARSVGQTQRGELQDQRGAKQDEREREQDKRMEEQDVRDEEGE